MASRRQFFKNSIAAAGGLYLSPLMVHELTNEVADALKTLTKLTPLDAARKDELWERIAQSFTVSRDVVDLNNAGVSPQPKVVQQVVQQYYQESNRGPSYYQWNTANKSRHTVKLRLAELAGASPAEIAINRNATEALGTVTSGLTFHDGDEIVMSKFDYPNMVHAWRQKELREKILIRWIDLPLPVEDEETFVKLFIEATTDRTKVWHLTHMINWTGQILPVKRLCDEARKRNIITIVDGAQSFAHLSFMVADLNPDYFGASLHKWLCAPYGLGMLFVKRENIAGLWPLFPNENPQSDDIKKFESLGTRSFTSELALVEAIEFHNMIGGKRKEERLRYLKNYWCEKVVSNSRVRIHTTLKRDFSCGIASFSIDGMDSTTVRATLFSEFKIIATDAKVENTEFVRISPNVYTTTNDLDKLVDAILTICKR
jgi:selenocysteine lyase/cysteine desulfurase